MINLKIKKFFKRIFSLISKSKFLIKIMYNYIQISSLPCGFLINNVYILLLIIISFLFSFTLTTNLIYLFQDLIILFNIAIAISIVYLFYLKFNFIIRLFNIFIKSISYTYFLFRNKLNGELKKMFWYYILNILISLVSLIIIFRISFWLNNYNKDLYSYVYLYTNLFSCLFGLMYIGYISNNPFKFNKIKLNVFSFFISFTFLIFFIILIYFLGFNLSKLEKLDFKNLKLNFKFLIDFKYLYNLSNDIDHNIDFDKKDENDYLKNKEFNIIHNSDKNNFNFNSKLGSSSIIKSDSGYNLNPFDTDYSVDPFGINSSSFFSENVQENIENLEKDKEITVEEFNLILNMANNFIEVETTQNFDENKVIVYLNTEASNSNESVNTVDSDDSVETVKGNNSVKTAILEDKSVDD
jgi:hypothetical protein